MKKYIKLLKPLRSLDLFTRPVHLMIKTQERHKTYCGALLTLLLVSLILVLLFMNFINIGQNPRSQEYEIYHESLNYTTQFNFTILLQTQQSVPFHVVINDMTVSPCNITSTELTYCFNQQVSLLESLTQSQYITIQINLGSSDIDTLVSGTQVAVSIPTYYYDLYDIVDPVKQRSEKIETSLSSDLHKTINIFMNPMTVISDSGLVFKQEQTQQVLSYSRYYESVDSDHGQQVLLLRIRLDKTELIQHRSYPKLQQILGEAGGLWNVLFTLAMFIQLPFSNLSYRLQIINSLFNFQNDDTEDDPVAEKITNEHQDIEKSPERGNNIMLDKKIPLCQSEANLPPVPILRKQKSWNQLSQLNMKKRLYSIQRKSQLITEADSDNQKARISQEISASIKRFFKVVTKKLNLNFLEYFTFQFPRKNNTKNQKYLQFEYAVQKIQKSLDILYIINKLHEIDKLKSILLNRAQIKMFDYLPKPFISADTVTKEDDNICSLLKSSKTPYQKALEAQQAFKEIITNYQDPINQRLINCMDEPLIDLLKIQLQSDQKEDHVALDQSMINQLVQSSEYKLDTARQ